MKIIFGILASKNENYSKFIDIWIDNIKRFKKGPLKEYIDFYFLYTEKDSQPNSIFSYSEIKENEGTLPSNGKDTFTDDTYTIYYNYYSEYKKDDSLMDSFVRRTIGVLDYLNKREKLGDYFIRTNLSTLFQFDILIKWAETLPLKNMIAGTIIDNINSIYTHLSGTNIVLTRDLMYFILVNREHVLKSSILNGDDARISSLVIENINVCLLLIKRLDFIKIKDKNLILFESTKTSNNLFCYRFKTENRITDTKVMNLLLNRFYDKDFNILDFITEIIKNKELPFDKIVKKNDDHDKLTSKLFTFTVDSDLMGHFNQYKDKNIKYVKDLEKRNGQTNYLM